MLCSRCREDEEDDDDEDEDWAMDDGEWTSPTCQCTNVKEDGLDESVGDQWTFVGDQGAQFNEVQKPPIPAALAANPSPTHVSTVQPLHTWKHGGSYTGKMGSLPNPAVAGAAMAPAAVAYNQLKTSARNVGTRGITTAPPDLAQTGFEAGRAPSSTDHALACDLNARSNTSKLRPESGVARSGLQKTRSATDASPGSAYKWQPGQALPEPAMMHTTILSGQPEVNCHELVGDGPLATTELPPPTALPTGEAMPRSQVVVPPTPLPTDEILHTAAFPTEEVLPSFGTGPLKTSELPRPLPTDELFAGAASCSQEPLPTFGAMPTALVGSAQAPMPTFGTLS